MQGDEAISKEQGFSVASCLTVTSFGKMLALPSFSQGGERQHEDKSLACAGLIPLLPTDRVPGQPGLVEIQQELLLAWSLLEARGQPGKTPAIWAAAPGSCAACRCSDSTSAR